MSIIHILLKIIHPLLQSISYYNSYNRRFNFTSYSSCSKDYIFVTNKTRQRLLNIIILLNGEFYDLIILIFFNVIKIIKSCDFFLNKNI